MVPRAQRIIQNLKKFGDIPVCIITGANDTVVPADQSERVHKEIPNSEFHKILKCGHIPQEENPEEFISIVSNFIKNKVK